MTPAFDPFDPQVNRLPADAVGKAKPSKRLPRHKRGELFISAPLPLSWLGAAGKLPGRALHVAIVVWWLAGMKKNRTVKWRPAAARDIFGLDYMAAHRGLQALEAAGLVRVERRRGRSPTITILDAPKGT